LVAVGFRKLFVSIVVSWTPKTYAWKHRFDFHHLENTIHDAEQRSMNPIRPKIISAVLAAVCRRD